MTATLQTKGRRATGASTRTSIDAADSRRWWILAVLGIAQLMVVLDATIITIALPSAQQALGFANADRQWVITAYTLAFGGLLLVGGRLSDLLGRKRTFLIGLVGFATASAVGGLSTTFLMLVAARAVQGAFAALLAPSALSLLTTTFADRKDRGKAFGIYGGIASGGAALGLLLGGTLTEYLDWRWTLYVNVAFAAVAGIGALVFLVDRGRASERRIDVPGTVAVVAGLASIVFGLNEAETRGWADPFTLSLLLVGPALLGIFAWIETRAAEPLLPFGVVKQRNRVGSYLAVFSSGIATFGTFVFLTFYFQQILGYSPIVTGLAYLPLVGALAVTSITANAVLLRRIGPRPLLSTGFVIAAAGLLLISRVGIDTSYLTGIMPGLVLVGIGLGAVFPPALNTATYGVPNSDAGVASALVTTSQQIGASVGTALLSTVAASATTQYLAHRNPTSVVTAMATVHSYNVASLVAVGILLGSAVICGLIVTNRPYAEGGALTTPGSQKPRQGVASSTA
ncbi:MAG TPA: MFS transporter [Jatrophihabitantaceae bacterium]|nr:MFS transporter [Jatrophihabitantaceae bacterium]